MAGRVSGLAITYATSGMVLLWSGLKGQTVAATVRAAAGGNTAALTQAGPQSAGSPTLTLGNSPPAASSPPGPASPAGTPSTAGAKANQATGRLMAGAYGWATGAEWTALDNVVMSESGWDSNAQNPGSSAYGIGQFLDTTWATVGYAKSADPIVQIAAMLAYIRQSYGDPVKAWAFHQANGYY